MITTQYIMSENSSDSISNRLAQPEKNTSQKKYITRLEGYNNTDQLCDRESLLTDLPESWYHKESLHNRYGLINHGDKIIPMKYRHILKEVHILSRPSNTCQNAHKEFYILSRPSKAMAQWKFQYMQKEVYILSRPSTNHSIVTQYTPREKDQDLPQLPSTLEDQASTLRCSNVRETRHSYSQLTESEKAKFQTPFTSNEARNYVEHNSVKKISQDLVHLTDTASASLISEPEEREEVSKTADTPAPALERAEEQSHTPKSQKSLYEPNKLTFTCKWS